MPMSPAFFCYILSLFIIHAVIQHIKEKLLDLFEVVIEIHHIPITAGKLFGIADCVRINVRASGSCQHRQSFAESPDLRFINRRIEMYRIRLAQR